MAQNENGEETQKSEHGSRRVIVSSTIVLSLSEADGGRCGQQVGGQKVLARRDGTLYAPTSRTTVVRTLGAGPRGDDAAAADPTAVCKFSYESVHPEFVPYFSARVTGVSHGSPWSWSLKVEITRARL